MNTIEQRVASLEAIVQKTIEAREAKAQLDAINNAMLRSIYTVVEELAQEHGLEQPHFLKHFENRFHFWRDYYLHQGAPQAAGTPVEDVAHISYPPLFHSKAED
jgi:hypothetical protein